MEYGKSALIKRTTNAAREGWTNAKVKDLIDSLWRDPMMLRWSGFWNAGAADTTIAFDTPTKVFSITPPVDGAYSFFQYRQKLSFHTISALRETDISADITEGLFVFYFDFSTALGDQDLHVLVNPTSDELREVFVFRTVVATLYWDGTNAEPLYFGDDRWGSEINPHEQWIRYLTGFAKRHADGGLTLYDYIINGDGSSNDHVRWKVNPGKFWHGDFLIDIARAGSTTDIPVLYWEGGLPRLTVNPTFQVIAAGTLCYNPTGTTSTPATSGKYVMYHAFATNDRLTDHHVVSVMGRVQYDSLADAWAGMDAELLTLHAEMPQTGKCHLATLFYEVNNAFTNTPKARLVSVANSNGLGEGNNCECHPPVSIASGSRQYLSITEQQVLAFSPQNLIAAITTIIGDTINSNNNTLLNNINAQLADGKYSDIITTALTTYTYITVWEVIDLQHRMGEFKVTIIIHDLSDDSTYHLQSTLGFDYINPAAEVSEQNNTITDGSVTLTLSINATDNLQAALSGMSENAKRIHFCFERCTLGNDGLPQGTGEFELDAEADISAWANLAGNGDMEMGADGTPSTIGNINESANLVLGSETELSAWANLEGTGNVQMGADADIDDLNAPESDAGLLYNFAAITDARQLAPSGYRVCTLTEVQELITYLGGELAAGGKLKALTEWEAPNTGATDEKEFTALPTGWRDYLGEFANRLTKTRIWIDNS